MKRDDAGDSGKRSDSVLKTLEATSRRAFVEEIKRKRKQGSRQGLVRSRRRSILQDAIRSDNYLALQSQQRVVRMTRSRAPKSASPLKSQIDFTSVTADNSDVKKDEKGF